MIPLRRQYRQLQLLWIAAALFWNFFAETPACGADLTSWRRRGATPGDLQLRIAALKPGDTLNLEKGRHEGPIIIRTPGVTIRGAAGSSLVGSGHGSVIVIAADDVTIEFISITGSGNSYDQVDAGVAVRDAKNIALRRLTVSDCLFGIDISNSRNIVVEDTHISSKNLDLGLRGDAIRLWAAKDVKIIGNTWADARDTVSWYSERVTFEGNEGIRSRYSIHSMYSKSLMIKDNRFYGNSVGIFIMYGEGTSILNNVVTHSQGTTGMGLGMKETSSVYASGNRFLYSAVGILVDNSPWSPTARNWFQNNLLAYNTVGVLFSDAREGNEFVQNRFQSNHTDVDSESRRQSRSRWHSNFWDKYDGFDRNKDNIGDTPYRIHRYSDLMSANHPLTGFFYGSPIAAIVGFMERLLPLTAPIEIVRDSEPRLFRGQAGGRHD